MSGIIGSNMDVPTIVNELMKRQTGQLTRLSQEEKTQEIKLSLFGQLKSAVDALNQALTGLKNSFLTLNYTATVSNTNLLAAKVTGNNGVVSGKHDVNVTKLATAATIGAKTTYNNRAQQLNLTGDLTFTVGANSFTVNVSATDTLDSIRDKINQAANNTGVTVSVLGGTDQNNQTVYSLVASSSKTGSANALSIGGSLASTFDFTNTIKTAQDAEFTIDGNTVVRSDNVINDVIDGVTFTILDLGQSSFTVSADSAERNSNVVTAMQAIVDSYNKLMDFIDQNSADRSLTETSVSMVKSNVQGLFEKTFASIGGITNIKQLGLKTVAAVKKTTSAGNEYFAGNRLELNADKLTQLLVANGDNVKKFITDSSAGFVKVAADALSKMTEFSGIISTSTQTVNESISRLNRAMDAEEARLSLMKDQLTAKYSLLSAMMDKFDRLSTMLDKTFNSMSYGGKK